MTSLPLAMRDHPWKVISGYGSNGFIGLAAALIETGNWQGRDDIWDEARRVLCS